MKKSTLSLMIFLTVLFFGQICDAHPYVLLVDGVGNGAESREWQRNLKDLSVEFKLWDRNQMGSPVFSDLVPYRLIIWSCGDKSRDTIIREEQQALDEYFNSGHGSLIVTGSRVASDLRWSGNFLRNIFGVEYDGWRGDVKKLVGRDIMSGEEFDPWGSLEIIKLDRFGSWNDTKILFGLQFAQGAPLPYPANELKNYGAASTCGRIGRRAMLFSFSLDKIFSSFTTRSIVRRAIWESGRNNDDQGANNDQDLLLNMNSQEREEKAQASANMIIRELKNGSRNHFDRLVREITRSNNPGAYYSTVSEIREFVEWALSPMGDGLDELEPLLYSILDELDQLQPLMRDGDDLDDLEPLLAVVNG